MDTKDLLIDFFKFFINEADMTCEDKTALYYVEKYLKERKAPLNDNDQAMQKLQVFNQAFKNNL